MLGATPVRDLACGPADATLARMGSASRHDSTGENSMRRTRTTSRISKNSGRAARRRGVLARNAASAGTPRLRRCGFKRLRDLYFARGGELAMRYGIPLKRVQKHLCVARAHNPGLLLRHVTHIEDLLVAIACHDGCGRAWSDLNQEHERTLTRGGRHGSDELEATVRVRRFFAEMRRDALSGRSTLVAYAGTRPLRSFLNERFHVSQQGRRRAAFLLDPSDSAYGNPLRFSPTGAEG